MDSMMLELNDDELQILLTALYEFVGQRQRPDEEGYVAQRYAGPGYSEEWLAMKLEAVKARNRIAEALRARLFSLPREADERTQA
jgi:hypothetical protein